MIFLTRIEPKFLGTADVDKQLGLMIVNGTPLCTLERPWLPSEEYPSGESGNSCIPAGEYDLIKAYSPKFDTEMYYIVNQDLGVFLRKEDRDHDWQRWGCMFHSANWVHQINGCIAPGLQLGKIGDKFGVRSSKNAMKIITSYLEKNQANKLYIDWN